MSHRFSWLLFRAVSFHVAVFAAFLLGNASQAAVVINEIMYHPSSENIFEEYIELLNTGATNVNLNGWRFSSGIEYAFPSIVLAPGAFLVVAADTATFTNKYPGVTNVTGGWTGRLSNSRNDLDLDDSFGNRIDSVVYADEGDWAVRQRTPVDRNHRGWQWFAAHDGFGRSAELVQSRLSNNHGQNWLPSLVINGTPGSANSVVSTNIAPMILDVGHLPIVPRSIDPVLVTARILDERTNNLSVTLFWRFAYTNLPFGSAPMFDDGLHDDGSPNDGVFAGVLAPQTNNAIVEFYISATDLEGLTRTWPAAAIETNGSSLGQAANALYQVDDSAYGGSAPLYKIIMREADRAELAAIGDAPFPGESETDATMNASFVSSDVTGTEVRYTIHTRNRGNGSRSRQPNNYRVAFNADNLWKNIGAIVLNGQYTHAQLVGSVLSLKAGLGGANSRTVQVRVNNRNLGTNSPISPSRSGVMFGAMYVANEAINSDWAENWFPDDPSGNVYRASRDILPDNFAWRGTNYTSYTNTWFKQSNTAENDWSDLLNMLRVIGTNDLFTGTTARSVIDVEQWMTYLAVMALFDNRETSINRGANDDYFMYAGVNDPRFQLMYYDLDTILGEGDTPQGSNTVFGAANIPAFNQLMHYPEFELVYYRTLDRLLATTFAKPEFDATLDTMLTDFVPEPVIERMKTWMDGRRSFVQPLVNAYLATNPPPVIPVISGEPRSPTPLRTATLTVSGNAVTQYRYKLNNGTFGATNSVATPITLSNLPHGSTNTIYVIAAGTNNFWTSEPDATISKTWVVNTNIPSVRINEVLARNTTTSNHFGGFPDFIELYNEGAISVNLSGLRLTDRAASPNKFTFPNGTSLAPGAFLLVLANNSDGTPGFHTGFSLEQDGEGVFLFDRATNGGALLDSVEFGLQLADFSIGRIGSSGEFVLTMPTLGRSNTVQNLALPSALKINEWLAARFAYSGPDYVELYNTDPLPAALGNCYFTDNPINDKTRHTIAPLSFIAGHGYRVFHADGNPEDGFNHLNFTLPAEQGIIALLAPDLALIDCVVYGPQANDIPQGRDPDGANRISILDAPTPGSANPGSTACTITSSNLTLLSLTNVWRFNQSNNLDGVSWMATNYNDASWGSGAGLLGFENQAALTNLIRTTLLDPRIPAPGLTPGHAYYFRAALNITNNLSGHTVTATAYVDDGSVIYVNGNEVLPRIRMNSGLATNTTLATGTPSGGDSTTPDIFIIPTSYFRTGTNVIAAGIHQSQTNSSDIVWGMSLIASKQFTNCGQSTVVLNEVFAANRSITNSAGRTPDWIELFNTSSTNIDLGDMSLSDTPGQPRKWVFSPNTIITPGERIVIEFDPDAPSSGTNTGFALAAEGGSVYLFRRPSESGAVMDSIAYGLQAADFPVGRIPDGSGVWTLVFPSRDSANIAAGLGNASFIRINEWMAAPADGDDWLELFNPNPQPVELAGLSLTDNSSDRFKSPFPPLSFLAPGETRKLTADGNQNAGADHSNFSLSSSGGFIGLYWPIGTQIDAVTYGPQTSGVSEGRLPDGTSTIVDFSETASPGAPNYLLLGNIVINELLSHTDPPLEDAIEIRNVGNNPADIGGWYLSNSGDELRKYLIPSNTVISAGGYAVFYEFQFGSGSNATVPFNFNSAHGDEAHLSQTDGNGDLTGYRARVTFGAAENGVSFGRFITSVGEEFVAMQQRTFGMDTPANLSQFRSGAGAANSQPRIGPVVFNEIHYSPAGAFNGDTNAAEFVELLNITTNAVALYDPNAATNTWRIDGGIEFTFPTNTTIQPGESIVVVAFDPLADPAQLQWFQTEYGLGTNVPVLGPFAGALSDTGDPVELLKPDPPQQPPAADAGFVPYVLVERVFYRNSQPWPFAGIGSGYSLQRLFPSAFGNEPLNWFAALPSAGTGVHDSDGDGLPNEWELANGLDPDSAAGDDGASGDPDDDGLTNAQEFMAGTAANNGADYLRINSIVRSNSIVTLRFIQRPGRGYTILHSDASPLGPWVKLYDVPAAGVSNVVNLPDNTPSVNRRFYRLVTPQLP